MTKTELREMIRECVKEELNKSTCLTEARVAPEESLLATHVVKNPSFEAACLTGDASKIMDIVEFEMKSNNLHTKGAQKLHDDIFEKTKGLTKIPGKIGEQILFFVWNSQLAGTGNGVLKVS